MRLQPGSHEPGELQRRFVREHTQRVAHQRFRVLLAAGAGEELIRGKQDRAASAKGDLANGKLADGIDEDAGDGEPI